MTQGFAKFAQEENFSVRDPSSGVIHAQKTGAETSFSAGASRRKRSH